MKAICFTCVLLTLVCAAPSDAYIITSFTPSVYLGGSDEQLAMMRVNLGIESARIEDFDDENFCARIELLRACVDWTDRSWWKFVGSRNYCYWNAYFSG